MIKNSVSLVMEVMLVLGLFSSKVTADVFDKHRRTLWMGLSSLKMRLVQCRY